MGPGSIRFSLHPRRKKKGREKKRKKSPTSNTRFFCKKFSHLDLLLSTRKEERERGRQRGRERAREREREREKDRETERDCVECVSGGKERASELRPQFWIEVVEIRRKTHFYALSDKV